MKHTNWAPLFLTNFFTVLNDNLFKTLIGFVGVLWLPSEYKSQVIGLATASLVIPYLIFSSWAGKLAKEHSKIAIIRIAKLAEIPLILTGFAGFYYENIYIVLVVNVLLGFQACMFSPSKYGIIRDIGGKEKISFGTGGMEMFTFLGVLIGTALAGYLADIALETTQALLFKKLLVALLASFSIIGYLLSLTIKAKEDMPDSASKINLNPISFTYANYKWAKGISGLNFSILGLGFFWMIASLLQQNMLIYGPKHYHLSNTQTSLIMASLAIGIGLGSFLAGILSSHKVKTSLTPLGGMGIVVSSLAIYTFNLPIWIFIVLVILTAFFAGFFKVPLNAFLQDRVKGNQLGLILGYNNISDFFFILISALLFMIAEPLWGTEAIFLIVSLLTLFITILLYNKVPGSKIGYLFK